MLFVGNNNTCTIDICFILAPIHILIPASGCALLLPLVDNAVKTALVGLYYIVCRLTQSTNIVLS